MLPVLSLSAAADTVSQGAYLALEEERRLLRHLTVDLVGHPRRAPLRVVEVCGVGDPATVAGLREWTPLGGRTARTSSDGRR